MPCKESYKEHIEYTFNAFCRVVIRYAAINAWRDRGQPQAHLHKDRFRCRLEVCFGEVTDRLLLPDKYNNPGEPHRM